jgi:hypothetical protein
LVKLASLEKAEKLLAESSAACSATYGAKSAEVAEAQHWLGVVRSHSTAFDF